MSTVDVVIEVGYVEVLLREVPYTVDYSECNPGRRTLTNGDPGYPSSGGAGVIISWSPREAADIVREEIREQYYGLSVDLPFALLGIIREEVERKVL